MFQCRVVLEIVVANRLLQALVYRPSRKLFWTAILGYHDCVSELNGSTMFHKSWLHIQSNFGLSLHGLTLVQN